MQLAVHAQREALGDVDETHLTHSHGSEIDSVARAASFSAFSRYSGALI